MTLFTVAALVLMVTLASAHVAPSVDDNNRYLKVTPLKGGFRLAYTVFFGEIPGAQERKILDENRDGTIDDAERKRFGDKLASEVAASLTLELVVRPPDAKSVPIVWQTIDVGLGGTSAVAAGAFSVDMIAYVCAPTSHIRLRDAFRIPRPGETEVFVEDSPGVTVSDARVGAADDPRHDWRFLGAGGPLTDEGLEVTWTAGATTPVLPAKCEAAPAERGDAGSGRGVPIAILVAVVVGGLVVGFVVSRLLRRK